MNMKKVKEERKDNVVGGALEGTPDIRVEDYLKKPYRIQLIRDMDGGGYLAEVVEFPGCVTYGETKEEALSMVEDAMRAWISTALERGRKIPEPIETREYSGKFLVRISSGLHRDLAQLAREEGISLNQLVSELLAMGLMVKRYISQTSSEHDQNWKYSPDHKGYKNSSSSDKLRMRRTHGRIKVS